MSVATEATLVDRVPKGLFIAGDWLSTPDTVAVEDPSTGEVLAEVADATEQDALAALAAADAAQASWAATAPRERGEILRRAYEEIIARRDELALLMTLEMGKPLAESRGEVAYAAEFFRWFAEEAVRIDGRYADSPDRTSRLLVMKQPVGPCLLITPWNFPLAMGTRKIGPAIAAGCTMVVKPAKQTPLSMLALAEILEHAGLPAGVLNVITSSSASRVMGPLIADPRARKLSFTGSTEVGRTLVEQSARQLLRVSMELGGNAPFLVFGDADVEEAVQGALLAKMRNGGEACTAANRFYVHESLIEEFSAALSARMSQPDGGPRHRAGRRRRAADRFGGARQGRRARRRRAARRGDRADRWRAAGRPGLVLPPDGARRHRRRCPPAATRRSSGRSPRSWPSPTRTRRSPPPTRPSMASSPICTPTTCGARCGSASSLQTGMIGLNQGIVSNAAAPFGGAKHSGFGREGGREGIAEYLETKYMAIAR